ncbi:hypothetical protein BRARA_I02578, partial [Brassica rapa]
ITFLKDIKQRKIDYRVQVKVLHSWRQWTKMAGDSLELVLSDAHGTKIHASCKKTYMDELAMKVPVGEWINIDNFSLTNAPLRVHFEKNPLKMNFLHNMDISESTLRIDDHFLDLVDFETILTGKNDTNILIGTYAENVYKACQEAEDGFIVCLIIFAKIGHFRGTNTKKN